MCSLQEKFDFLNTMKNIRFHIVRMNSFLSNEALDSHEWFSKMAVVG